MQRKTLFPFAFSVLICTFAQVMKIVIDDKIPYIREKLDMVASEVVCLPGGKISAVDVRDADALIVRTRTRCDAQLLRGSNVQFVATATIGFDHIDTHYLRQAGIRWTNCPGCNAGSVAQYVECALRVPSGSTFCLISTYSHPRIAVHLPDHLADLVLFHAVHHGQGKGIHDGAVQPGAHGVSEEHGVDQVPLRQSEGDVGHPHDGPHATYHLADVDFFQSLSRVPYIINTSRGEVVDGNALLAALQDGRVRDAVIDVWENEPHLDRHLLQRVFIGTPHIAGYSADGKVNADNMVISALCQHFHIPHPGMIQAPSLPDGFRYTGNPLELYNPLDDSRNLKEQPQAFESLRNHYPLRRERAD